MLSFRLPKGARRGLLGAVCAILIAPGAAHADRVAEPDGPDRRPASPTSPGARVGSAGAAAAAVPGAHPTGTRLRRAEVEREINAAEQQLEIVIENYDAVGVQLAATQQQSAAIAAALAPLRQRVAQVRERVGQIAAELYVYRKARLAAILAAGSPRAALDQLSMASSLVRQERSCVDALHVAQDGYAARTRDLDALTSRQAGQRTALASQRATIEARIAALRQLRTSAGATWNPPAPLPPLPVPVYAPGPAGRAVAFALAQLGKPYAFGAAGPGAYDCSGLTMAAWQAAGVALPHNAAAQWHTVAHVTRSGLRPGDLVFYFSDIHHVAVYLGGDRMVHAPTYGRDVMISRIDVEPIYGYGRPG